MFGEIVKPLSYHIDTYRARNSESKKRKLLSSLPGISGKSLTCNPGALFQAYDVVIALDSNTPKEPIEGTPVTVLGIAHTRRVALPYPELVEVRASHAIEFRNLQEPRERYGWQAGIHIALNDKWFAPEDKVAVVVDAYANQLIEYNCGNEVVPGFRLPRNVTLVYATSDTGQDYLINKCIRAADKIANITLRAIRAGQKNTGEFKVAADAPFDRMRFWQFSHSE